MPKSTDISRFTPNHEHDNRDLSIMIHCGICNRKIKTISQVYCDLAAEYVKSVNIWSKTYCEYCWTRLKCKSCGVDIDKKKAFKGADNHIYCKDCMGIEENSTSSVCVLV